MKLKTFIAFGILIFIMLSIQGSAETYTTEGFVDNSTSFEYNEWIMGEDSAWDKTTGWVDEYVWTPLKDIFTVDDETLQQQVANGNGNLTSQIGMQQSLFEQKKENILTLINQEWDYVVILLMILFEIIKSVFYIGILYGLLYIFFVAVPQVFMKIKESLETWISMRYSQR